MKGYVFKFITIITFIAVMVSCGDLPTTNEKATEGGGISTGNSADNSSTIIDDEEIQTVFRMINEFRTGKEAYYLNSDNSTMTNLVGRLDELTLDEDLCKAAQIRADEIVGKFSHTRPNGKNCFTVLDDLSISRLSAGENIAAGNKSGEKTFLQWKEDNKDYNGQGHRRNMLGANYKRIGLAYAYDPNSIYKYYWVMILTD